jgi:biotin carboxyl carrier protein
VSGETLLRRAGAERRVRLTRDGDAFNATVDDRPCRVACLHVGPATAAAGGTTVEELALEIDGRPCRALVARQRDRVLVALDGRVYVFDTGDDQRQAQVGAAGSGLVSAPMPGKIVTVLVGVGERVEAGQPLVVLEAMKMESTLAAEVAGSVSTIHVLAGATVEAGATLIEIAPAA